MKIKETSPGKVYALDSMNGCEVMNGNVVVQVPAMTQTIVIANSDCLTSEDDTVTITEVFKLAPALYRQGEDGGNWMKEAYDGLVSIVGADNFKWEFLDNPYRVVVHTDRLDEFNLASVTALLERVLPQNIEVEQYNHNMEISWRDINKYAECVTIDDLLAVNPNYQNDLTSDGEWVYPVPALKDIKGANTNGSSFYGAKALKKWSVPVPNLESAGWAFKDSGLTEWTVGFPAMKGGWGLSSQIFSKATFIRFAGDLSKLEDGSQMFWGVPNMKSFESTLPALIKGGLMFEGSQLNKDSALRVLNSIPEYTSGKHPICIGIHIDHKNDEEVLKAITNAEKKGWTVSVQWNPNGGTYETPAAATYGLRKPPIYARVSEYERPDGTVERVLDWGHYVTDPENYEEFRSVEEAREYYGLPAEEEETIIEEQ